MVKLRCYVRNRREKVDKGMKKCNVAFFIPTGISITGYDEIKGKDVKHKLSFMKRQNWIDYIAQKANNTPV